MQEVSHGGKSIFGGSFKNIAAKMSPTGRSKLIYGEKEG